MSTLNYEIKWDEHEEEVVVTGSRVKGTITVTKGDKFITFKRFLSKRKKERYDLAGSDVIEIDKDFETKIKDNKGVEDLYKAGYEKDLYLEEVMYKAWSKDEHITKEVLLEDEELIDLRAVALDLIKRQNKIIVDEGKKD